VKGIALKTFISLFGAFAAYYTYFLVSVFYGLWGPNRYWCATSEVWALQGAAILFAPPALIGSVALWFAGRKKQKIDVRFWWASRVVQVILILCALTNFVIFIP